MTLLRLAVARCRRALMVRIGIVVVAGASPATSATRSRRCVDRPYRRGSIDPILPFSQPRSSQPPPPATRASPRTTSASADSASRCLRRLGASVNARATRRIPRAVRRVRPGERRPPSLLHRRPRHLGPTTRRRVGTCIACWRPSREIPPRGDSSGTKIDGEATRKSIPAGTRALPPPLSIVGVRSACGAAGGVVGRDGQSARAIVTRAESRCRRGRATRGT